MSYFTAQFAGYGRVFHFYYFHFPIIILQLLNGRTLGKFTQRNNFILTDNYQYAVGDKLLIKLGFLFK